MTTTAVRYIRLDMCVAGGLTAYFHLQEHMGELTSMRTALL